MLNFYRQHCTKYKLWYFFVWGEIWHTGVDRLHAEFSPDRCRGGVWGIKTEYLSKFLTHISEYRCLAPAYTLRDFYEIFRDCV